MLRLTLFLIFCLSLFADESILFVSLGSDCHNGLALNEFGLRKIAFPFDWLVTGNNQGLIRLLDNDFAFFLDERFLTTPENAKNSPNNLTNTLYDIEFTHDGKWFGEADFAKHLEMIKPKYERRINRFRQIRHHQGKVIFIRNFYPNSNDNPEFHRDMVLGLRNALRRFFPFLDFTLVIATWTEIQTASIHDIDGIVEFKMDYSIWQNEYNEMFKTMIDLFTDPSLQFQTNQG